LSYEIFVCQGDFAASIANDSYCQRTPARNAALEIEAVALAVVLGHNTTMAFAFVSYRRSDAQLAALGLYLQLRMRIGPLGTSLWIARESQPAKRGRNAYARSSIRQRL